MTETATANETETATETAVDAPRPNWARVALGVWRLSGRRNLGLVAAGVAFYGVLALFPALAALIALLGVLSDPTVVETQLALLDPLVPEQALALIEAQVGDLIEANNRTLGWATLISTGAALWSTRAGVGALLGGLNAVYGLETRGGLWQVVTALALTGALIVIALIALISIVVAPVLLALFPPGLFTRIGLDVVRWGLAVASVLAGLGLVYRYGPNRRGSPVAWLSPGSVFALVIWAAASLGFSIYLTNFGNYNEVYGSIGAVIALLMWVFISAYVLLLGAAVNAEIERQTRADKV